jgi:hypothetical protein
MDNDHVDLTSVPDFSQLRDILLQVLVEPQASVVQRSPQVLFRRHLLATYFVYWDRR